MPAFCFCSLFRSEHEFDPDSYKIPFVILSLKTFAPQVHSLLQTHEGTVPLLRWLSKPLWSLRSLSKKSALCMCLFQSTHCTRLQLPLVVKVYLTWDPFTWYFNKNILCLCWILETSACVGQILLHKEEMVGSAVHRCCERVHSLK